MGANAEIVQDRHFENGLVKVQRGDEKSLTNLEKNALARFKVDATTASATEDAEESYMEKFA